MAHAWCSDTERDEAVRAAEDKRNGRLPTLREAIAHHFADAAERPLTASKAGEPQSGMRTERITLEVTHNADLSAREWRMWRTIFDPKYGESVRIVEETHFDDLAQVAMERDRAVREREIWKALYQSSEAGVALLAMQLKDAERRASQLERDA
jgi:hypothetical protein